MVCDSFTKTTKVSTSAAGLDGQRCVGRDQRGRKANEVSILNPQKDIELISIQPEFNRFCFHFLCTEYSQKCLANTI